MKRFIKSAMLAAMACSVIAGGAACKPNNDENKGKTAIRLSYFIGEFGDEWLKSQAKEWSASNEKYYVDVKTNLNLGGTIVADIRSGSAYDVFITEDCSLQQLFAGDYLEDLSDVLSVKPEGKKTIGEKLNDAEHWAEAAGYNGKTYLLPYNISPCGLIFDYDRFEENGWLVTDSDGNVSVGKDGIGGTYDDGQPAMMSEFKAMCEKIKASGVDDLFLYMGALHPEYVNNVAYAYLAGTLGEEGYKTFYKHDSQGKEIELIDGTKAVVTIEDGYKTWQMKGVDDMAEFLQDYLCNTRYVSEATLSDRALSVDASHTKFIQVGDKTPAFIVEGNWFEYGSKSLIEANVRYGGKAYGESDYRYMLLPSAEGEKSRIFSQTGGSMCVTKQSDALIFIFRKIRFRKKRAEREEIRKKREKKRKEKSNGRIQESGYFPEFRRSRKKGHRLLERERYFREKREEERRARRIFFLRRTSHGERQAAYRAYFNARDEGYYSPLSDDERQARFKKSGLGYARASRGTGSGKETGLRS